MKRALQPKRRTRVWPGELGNQDKMNLASLRTGRDLFDDAMTCKEAHHNL